MQMGIGKNIKYHRDIRLKWTLERLSEASGVDVGTISALENRDSKRSMHFGAIAKGLGLTLDELQINPEEWGKSHSKSEASDPTIQDKSQPTVAETIERLGALLAAANPSTRESVADLLLNYSRDPAQGAQIIKAIELLLKPDANS